MHDLLEKLINESSVAAGVSVHEWAVIKTNTITFSPELLECCKTNACGNYNKSWTCPPAGDSMEKHREKILSFEHLLVLTTLHKLEDSFDYEGMTRGSCLHTKLTLEIRKKLADLEQAINIPVYSVEACPVCEYKENKTCAFPEPCHNPEERISSLESAGINVTELSKAAGVAYNNGVNTVTYFSLVLL